jgi:hypothetical protein
MPNRILKESICYSDDIDQLAPFEETVFYRLMVRCDDNGRLDARPAFVRSMLFATKPSVTEKQVRDAINRLAEVGLIRMYEVEDRPYLFMPTWEEHQRVRNIRSKYPDPPQSAAIRGELPQSAASCGELPHVAARARAESESESESISESNTMAAKATGGGDEVTVLFDLFWRLYPRKVKRAEALKAWKRIKPDRTLAEQIIAAVEAWIKSDAWTKDGGQFIPHPTTFLNGQRWTDEIPPAPDPSKPSGPRGKPSSFEYSNQREYTPDFYDSLIEKIE